MIQETDFQHGADSGEGHATSVLSGILENTIAFGGSSLFSSIGIVCAGTGCEMTRLQTVVRVQILLFLFNSKQRVCCSYPSQKEFTL